MGKAIRMSNPRVCQTDASGSRRPNLSELEMAVIAIILLLTSKWNDLLPRLEAGFTASYEIENPNDGTDDEKPSADLAL